MMEKNSLLRKQVKDLDRWNEVILKLPDAHLLQTREWSEIKSSVGWSPLAFLWEDKHGNCQAACLILKRQMRILTGMLTVSILYAPKGPLLNWHDPVLVKQVLDDLILIAKDERSLFIKIDPDIICGTGIPDATSGQSPDDCQSIRDRLIQYGWHFSKNQIQFRNSIIIDLKQTDEQILGNMKQKTRYNIRLAEKKGVVVHRGTLMDSAMLYKMYAETSLRNGFTIRERKYYERVWKILFDAGMLEFLIASSENRPIAGLVLFHFGKRAYYFYGMSSDSHREMMPTYLLQWEAIRTARLLGCETYDLWGAPDEFTDLDPMWGVFRFKEGLGGLVIRTIGAWDYPVKLLIYNIYINVMPRIMALMRLRRKSQTIREVI